MKPLVMLRGLYAAQRPPLVYLGNDLAGATLNEMSGNPALALVAVGVSPQADAVAGMGAMRVIVDGGHAGGSSAYGVPVGDMPRSVEVVVKFDYTFAGAVDLVRWGSGESSFALSILPQSGTLRLTVGSAGSLSMAFDVVPGEAHHLAADMDSDGTCRLFADGVWLQGGQALLPPADPDPQAGIVLMAGAPVGAALVAAAIAPARLDEPSLAARGDVISGRYQIAGYAGLAGGSAAVAVAVRRLTDGTTLAVLQPAADTSFATAVPAGEYDVVCYGPSGYAPAVVGPISAQPVV